jgi:hypothetical protein
LDLSFGTEYADDYHTWISHFWNHGHDFGNLFIPVDDLERKLYPKHFSGYDPDFSNSDDLKCRIESKSM